MKRRHMVLKIHIFKFGVISFHVRVEVFEHDFKHTGSLWELDFSYCRVTIANAFWKWEGARVCL